MKSAELSETGLHISPDGTLRSRDIYYKNGLKYMDGFAWEQAVSWAVTLSITRWVIRREMGQQKKRQGE